MINPQKSKEKYGIKLTATINHSPLPVLIEYPDGREEKIEKAYFVTGRTAAVKILIDGEDERANFEYEKKDLNSQISSLEKELRDAEDCKDELEDCKDELEDWTDNFDESPDVLKARWDAIEEAVGQFAEETGMCLVANDAININGLREIYEAKERELKDADETIGEMRLEISAANKRIKDLENMRKNFRPRGSSFSMGGKT